MAILNGVQSPVIIDGSGNSRISLTSGGGPGGHESDTGVGSCTPGNSTNLPSPGPCAPPGDTSDPDCGDCLSTSGSWSYSVTYTKKSVSFGGIFDIQDTLGFSILFASPAPSCFGVEITVHGSIAGNVYNEAISDSLGSHILNTGAEIFLDGTHRITLRNGGTFNFSVHASATALSFGGISIQSVTAFPV